MDARRIFISEFDRKRLVDLIEESLAAGDRRQKGELESLAREMKDCRVVPPDQVPDDLITMNSRVRIRDLDDGSQFEYTLVFPDEADFSSGCISVLAPIGTAMLGYKVGDTFSWHVPSGERRLKVEALLYQPESAGDFDR